MTRARNSANLASHGNLFVDIANDRTGIGSVVPAQNLHVAGTAGFHADVTFTGDAYNSTWDRSLNSLRFTDNARIRIGTDNDLQLYHNGSHSYIVESGTGSLLIQSNDQVALQTTSGENMLTAAANGAVNLLYDHSGRLQTTTYGVNVTGTTDTDGLVVSGVATVTTMNVTGVLTYDDVTSVDSVGIVTARAGVHITGNGADLVMNSAGGIFTGNGGNATDPIVANVSDTNTGYFYPAADTIAVTTGGTERLRVDSSGQLQIGSSTLTNYNEFSGPGRLNIQNNSADGTVDFSQGIIFTDNVNNTGTWTHGGIVCTGSTGYNGNLVFGTDGGGSSSNTASGITERVRITSGGSLLVGKTVGTMATAGTRIDPQSTLITGSSTSTNLATASGAALSLINNSATDNNFSNIGGYNSNSLVTSQINFVNTSHSSRTGDITFMTHNGSSMPERLRITSGGNIGVAGDAGTDFSLLDGIIINAANGDAGLMINSSSSSQNAYISFSYGSGSSTSHADQFSAYIGRVGDDTLIFGTNNTIRVQVTSSGHVVPNTDSQYDLGLTGTRWRNIYADTLYGDGSNLTGINTDLVSDTSPQLGGDLDTNSHHILLDDDHEVKFGANSDLRIFHANGNANFIQSYNNHDLRIHTFGTSAKVRLQVNESENSVVCTPNGPTELYYDNEKMFQTNQDGSEFFDSDNNCNVYFTCNGTRRGYIFVESTNGGKLSFYDNQNHPMLSATKDGAVELYHDNTKRFETSSTGGSLTGVLSVSSNIRVSGEIDLGTANGNKFMDVCLGDNYGFYLRSTSGEGANHEMLMLIERNKGASFYWDAHKKLETTNIGCKITGGHGDGLQIENGGTNLSSQIKLKNTTVNKEYTLGVAGNTGANGQNSSFVFRDETANITRLEINTSGHLLPGQGSTYDLGGTGRAWNNLYVNDMHFSNEGSSNSVDGTWGDWTLQEGENDVFMINNRTGKKFAITMREVS